MRIIITLTLVLLVALSCLPAPTTTPHPTATPESTITSDPPIRTLGQVLGDPRFYTSCLATEEEQTYFSTVSILIDGVMLSVSMLETLGRDADRSLRQTPQWRAQTDFVISDAKAFAYGLTILDTPQRLSFINDDFVAMGNSIIANWSLYADWLNTDDLTFLENATSEAKRTAELSDSLAVNMLSLCP